MMKIISSIPNKVSQLSILIGLILSACAPSPSSIQTAIVQTQATWTKTPIPRSTPRPTTTPESLWSHCVLGNTMTRQYYDQLLQQRTCIYGVITKKDEIKDTGDMIYNIYPLDKPITYLILVREYKVLQENFPGATGILTTADVGNCIVVIGYPSQFDDGSPVFLGIDVRDIPLLVGELGATNPSVQEITTLCK